MVDEKCLPADWNSQFNYHGFSRNRSQGTYDVKLSVLGVQRFLTSANTQQEAARMYDLAVWKLAVFIVNRLRPNFDEDFLAICQPDVDAQFPALNKIYSELAAKTDLPIDRDEQHLRSDKINGLQPCKRGTPDGRVVPEVSSYQKYLTEIERVRGKLIQDAAKLITRRASLSFNKFPELTERSAAVEKGLHSIERELRELSARLKQHETAYNNFLGFVQSTTL